MGCEEGDRERADARRLFRGAKTIFLDPLAESFDDPDHSADERRFITLGMSSQQRLLFVAHADRGVDRFASTECASRRAVRLMPTKNAAARDSDELRPEYDLSKLTGGVRGKYYERATAGTTLVLLEPDVADAFSDGRTVNQALRALITVARTQVRNKAGGKLPHRPLQPSSRRKRKAKSQKGSRAARG